MHYDNLVVVCATDPTLSPLPSYTTVRRYMKAQGLLKQPGARARLTPGAEAAEHRVHNLEVRSFEIAYVHGLWHLDFHQGSCKVLTCEGRWATPLLLGVLDDCSRLAGHVQGYLEGTAENLVHGLCPAFQKRALPRALMTDNGGAMVAEEVRQGLHDLGILHQTTLPYSPYQNAQQEVFWATVEGRLIAMIEGVEELPLDLLNEATQAGVEREYHRTRHSELGCTPLERYLQGPDVGRESPPSDALRHTFRAELSRTQPRSDLTHSLAGRRFEIPSRYRHLERVQVRYARWDPRSVDLVDTHTQQIVCPLYPLDKSAHANGLRRRLDPPAEPTPLTPASGSGVAPLLRKLMADYAACVSAQIPRRRQIQPMNKKLLALYGLKWNPFSPELPTEAVFITPKVENFLWRIEHTQGREGGFALISGDPGSGKSGVLRLLAERLEHLREVTVGVLTHPQSNLADFYREMGDIFAVGLKPNNRGGGFKALRERWQAHLENTLLRPVLLIDEAQEMSPVVLSELRVASGTRFDSRLLLSVVLAGDGRLPDKLRREELLPLGSRIRTRLVMEYATRDELLACLQPLLATAANSNLMTPELIHTLCDHALGNYRVMTTLAAELLTAAAQREATQLDEKLYLEVFSPPNTSASNTRRTHRQR